MAKEKIDQIKRDLSLSKLDEAKLDVSQIIFRLNDRINEVGSKNDPTITTNYNILVSGIRLLQSNLNSRIIESDNIYLGSLVEAASNAYDINEKLSVQYKRLDLLHRVRDNSLTEILYATLEGETPGALSKFIATRIKEKDGNFILGILGPPRSGKSSCGLQICYNVSKLTGIEFTKDDIVYTHSSWLQTKQIRRTNNNLKGSAQQIDEGQALDSQNWFDTEVKEIVNHLRTQGADNTLTVIISPMLPDFANKARGLFHAILYPWKIWGKQYVELTDTGNIDYDKGISSWKLDFIDLDPITGKTWPGKLKAALGDIIKVDCKKPPQSIWVKYLTKSKKYKKNLQEDQLRNIRSRRLKKGDTQVLEEIVDQIKKELEHYRKGKDGQNINKVRIMRKFGIGRSYADRVEDSLIDLGLVVKATKEVKKVEKQKRKYVRRKVKEVVEEPPTQVGEPLPTDGESNPKPPP